MKKIGLFLITGFMFFSCNQPTENMNNETASKEIVASKDSVRDGILIHITESYDDPHRVLMPLKMATLMAGERDVLVYMDIHAVELLVRGAENLEYEGFESSQVYIQQILDKQVGIYACPTCLKLAGFNPDSLMEGIQVAQKDKFFNFTEGRVITLDY